MRLMYDYHRSGVSLSFVCEMCDQQLMFECLWTWQAARGEWLTWFWLSGIIMDLLLHKIWESWMISCVHGWNIAMSFDNTFLLGWAIGYDEWCTLNVVSMPTKQHHLSGFQCRQGQSRRGGGTRVGSASLTLKESPPYNSFTFFAKVLDMNNIINFLWRCHLDESKSHNSTIYWNLKIK